MPTYYHSGSSLLPEAGHDQPADAPIPAAITIQDFRWWLGLRVYDPEAQEARLEVVHLFPETACTVSRTWIFPCSGQWDISDCYDAILSLPAYQGSVMA